MHTKPGSLVIMGHPDDESLWLGGAIVHRVRRGIPVDLICCTGGEAGTVWHLPVSSDPALVLIRLFELYRACKLLGVRRCFVPGFPDGKLKERARALAAYLVYAVRRLKPREVITFGPDGITGHRDHKALYKIIPRVLREAAEAGNYPDLGLPHRPESLKSVVIPRSKVKQLKLKFAGTKDKGITTCEVSPYLDLKKRAIACHLSQAPVIAKLLPRDRDKLDRFLATEHLREESF